MRAEDDGVASELRERDVAAEVDVFTGHWLNILNTSLHGREMYTIAAT